MTISAVFGLKLLPLLINIPFAYTLCNYNSIKGNIGNVIREIAIGLYERK